MTAMLEAGPKEQQDNIHRVDKQEDQGTEEQKKIELENILQGGQDPNQDGQTEKKDSNAKVNGKSGASITSHQKQRQKILLKKLKLIMLRRIIQQ